MKFRIPTLALFVTACLAAAPATPIDKTVVTVNGKPITESQVLDATDTQINAQAEQERQRGLIYDESSRKDTRAYLRDDILHMLIERQLIADQLKTDHLEITPEEVQERFTREAGDRHQTLDEAKASIAQQGQTVQSVADGLRQTMGVERLFKAHAADQKEMSDAEAHEFYNANPNYFAQPELRRVSRILFRLPPNADQATKEATQKRAQQVLDRLRKGEEFAALAQHYSEDTATQPRGGDRGWSPRGWVASPDSDPFGNVAFGMKQVGDTSDVVLTQDGYEILKLTGLKPARLPPFEEVEAQIRREYMYRKIGDFWNAYGTDLWKKATIVWSPEELTRQAEKAKKEREFEQQMQKESATQAAQPATAPK